MICIYLIKQEQNTLRSVKHKDFFILFWSRTCIVCMPSIRFCAITCVNTESLFLMCFSQRRSSFCRHALEQRFRVQWRRIFFSFFFSAFFGSLETLATRQTNPLCFVSNAHSHTFSTWYVVCFFPAEQERVRGHVRGVAFCIYTMCERVTIDWQDKLMRPGATSA